MRQPVIAISHVSAVYGRGGRQVQALRDVTRTVQPGEIFGLSLILDSRVVGFEDSVH